MPRFEVLADSVVVGHSDLELGDPTMGVAAGKFLPSPAYAGIQPIVVAARGGSKPSVLLVVRLVGGQELPAQGGVQILDYSAELGDEGLEIEVLGIGYPLYADLFPARVQRR